MQASCRSGAKRRSIHNDGVAFDVAIEIKMRTITGVENRIVFKNDDGGFDGVQRGTASGKNIPSGGESRGATVFASSDGFVRNVPSSSVNNQGMFHGNENCKGANGYSEARNGVTARNRAEIAADPAREGLRHD